MKKEIFRVGDRVFDINFGWGKIKSIKNTRPYPITAVFNGLDSNYSYNGELCISRIRTLSFTEYGFDNRFSQERPVNYEDCIEKWGKFWNDNPEYFTIGILKGYEQDSHKPFQSISLDFQNFEPLTDEQIKILELK